MRRERRNAVLAGGALSSRRERCAGAGGSFMGLMAADVCRRPPPARPPNFTRQIITALPISLSMINM